MKNIIIKDSNLSNKFQNPNKAMQNSQIRTFWPNFGPYNTRNDLHKKTVLILEIHFFALLQSDTVWKLSGWMVKKDIGFIYWNGLNCYTRYRFWHVRKSLSSKA